MQASSTRTTAARPGRPARHLATVAVALALVGGAVACGDDDEPTAAGSAGPVTTPSADAAAPEATSPASTATPETTGDGGPASTDTTAPTSPTTHAGGEDPAASGPALRVDGLGDHGFGDPMDAVVADLTATFGPPSSDQVNPQCPAGPTRIAMWDAIAVLGQGDVVQGWSYVGGDPVLRTPEGITVGTTAAELAATHPAGSFVTSSVGEEFHVEVASSVPSSYLGAILDGPSDAAVVTNLYSGLTCFFR